jgi:hypothetical protein
MTMDSIDQCKKTQLNQIGKFVVVVVVVTAAANVYSTALPISF